MATASIASGQGEARQPVMRKNRPRSCFKNNTNSYADLRSDDSLSSSQLEHWGSQH